LVDVVSIGKRIDLGLIGRGFGVLVAEIPLDL
jgi:hypothetical protein